MATTNELNDVECENNSGHKNILLHDLRLRDIPLSHRALSSWAQLRLRELLAVRIEAKSSRPGAASSLDSSGSKCMRGLDYNVIKLLNFGSERRVDNGIGQVDVDNEKLYYGNGCITGVDVCQIDKVALIVHTVAHLWYNLGKEIITTVFLRNPDTGEVLESSNVVVKEVKFVDDIAIISVIFDNSNNNNVFSDIQDALRADFDTLYGLVLRKYQTVPLSLSSFLKDEINCIKSIGFLSDKHEDLEIQLEATYNYLIDVILFISAFVSHDYILLEVMGKIANGSVINTGTESSAEPAVKQFSAQQTELLNSLKNALCNGSLDENISEVDSYLKCLLPFKISIHLKCSTVIVMRVGSLDVPAGFGIELNSGEGDDSTVSTILTALISYPHNVKQPYVTFGYVEKINWYRKEMMIVNIKAPNEVDELYTVEGDDSKVVDVKMCKEMQGNNPATSAALSSYLQQPNVTLGYVEKVNWYGEVFYTSQSCAGTSGSSVYLIERIPGSEAELKGIRFATHSSSNGSLSVGVLLFQTTRNNK